MYRREGGSAGARRREREGRRGRGKEGEGVREREGEGFWDGRFWEEGAVHHNFSKPQE